MFIRLKRRQNGAVFVEKVGRKERTIKKKDMDSPDINHCQRDSDIITFYFESMIGLIWYLV